MIRRFMLSLAAWLLIGLALVPARADLHAYLARPEPAFKWEKRGEKKVYGGTIYNLHLVSQVWQGHTWEHQLQIFRPDNLRYAHFCALYNTGGGADPEDERMGMHLARTSGALYATVYGNPKQPLYGGKYEDALIVYTWGQYLKTGDATWPLHFPMAKVVIKAMDAIQAFAQQEKWKPVNGFLISSASKRGWTTWLVGASRDPRVKAIAPMVIDILNIPAQLPHMLEAYEGQPSEQIADYTNAGFIQVLQTPAGKRLLQIEDPYSYRELYTMPKLIILGTNDRYWTQDALNLYWDGIPGPKWILYTPNSGHGLEDRGRVFRTLAAFIRANAINRPFPEISWEYVEKNGGTELSIRTSGKPKSAYLFRNASRNKDFREARWGNDPMDPVKDGFTAFLSAPRGGFSAMFGDVLYEMDGMPFTLSTQIKILGRK